jgi:hypothetical protein
MARDLGIARTDTASTHQSSADPMDNTVRGIAPIPDLKAVRARQSRPALSTVFSSNSGREDSTTEIPVNHDDENTSPMPAKPKPAYHGSTATPTHESGTKHRVPLGTSDVSSLNCLQDLVSPQALLNSRFVSAPLVEAKIRLPPSEENMAARARKQGTSKHPDDDNDDEAEAIVNVPFDRESGPPEKDPSFRWSVDF